MRQKFIQERASLLTVAGAKLGAMFVVSTTAAHLPRAETASYGCKACSTVFASNKGSEPFCVNCGSEDVVPNKAVAQALPKSDATLSSIECKSCHTHNVLSTATASMLDGHLHCVECGTQLEYDVDDLEDPIIGADEADIEDALETTEIADTISGEDRGGMTDDAPIIGADEADIEDALPTKATSSKTGKRTVAQAPAGNAVPKAPADGENKPVTPTAPTIEPMVDMIADDTMVEHADFLPNPDEMVKDEQACEYSEVSLSAVILARNPKAALTLATSSDEILAFADGVPVARLSKVKAGAEAAAVFHTNSFTQSIARMASEKGIGVALAGYRFDPIRVQFPVGATVRARTAAKVNAATAAVQELQANHKQDLLQCLSLASVALTKNMFRTKANALKNGFVTALQTAGVKNATVLVDRVFAAHGEAYHRQMFEMASEFQSKPLEYRNTLSETLADMNTMPMPEGMPNEETQEVMVEHATDDSSLDHLMENAAVRPFRKPVIANTQSSIHSIRAAAGGSLFS